MDKTKILKNKSYCLLPWSGFIVEPNGTVKNCVQSTNKLGNVETDTMHEIIHSTNNLDVKQKMLEDAKPASCDGCYFQEKNRSVNFENISSRIYYMKNLAKHVDLDRVFDKDYFQLKHIDLRWSNKCNQACVYCGPEVSSKWAQELGQKVGVKSSTTKKLKNYVYGNIKNLQNVYLAGGEPTLMKENQEFLRLLLKENPEVQLRINTNLSTIDNPFFDLVRKFRNVHWTISVENLEQEYEYVRFHGNWATFINNLEQVRTYDHKIGFNMLFFILNYHSIFDTVAYFQKMGFHNQNFVIGPIEDPLPLNIRCLNKSLQQDVITQLKYEIQKSPGYLLQNSYENILKYMQQDYDQSLYSLSMTQKFLATLDERRNTSYQQTFPHLINND